MLFFLFDVLFLGLEGFFQRLLLFAVFLRLGNLLLQSFDKFLVHLAVLLEIRIPDRLGLVRVSRVAVVHFHVVHGHRQELHGFLGMLGIGIHKRRADPHRDHRRRPFLKAQQQRFIVASAVHHRRSVKLQQRPLVFLIRVIQIAVFLVPVLFFLVFGNAQRVIVQVIQPAQQPAHHRGSEGVAVVSLAFHPCFILVQHDLQDLRAEVHAVGIAFAQRYVPAFQAFRHLLHPVKELVPGLRQLLLGAADFLPDVHVDAQGFPGEAGGNRDDLAVLLQGVLHVRIHALHVRGDLFVAAQVRQVVPVAHRAEFIPVIPQHIDVHRAVPVHHLLQHLGVPVLLQHHGDIAPGVVDVIDGLAHGVAPAQIADPQPDAAPLGGIGVFQLHAVIHADQQKAVRHQVHAVAGVLAVVHGHGLRRVKLRRRPHFPVQDIVQGVLRRVVAGRDPAVVQSGQLHQRFLFPAFQVQAVNLHRGGTVGVRPDRVRHYQAAVRAGGNLAAEVIPEFDLGAGSFLHVDDFQHLGAFAVYGHRQLAVQREDFVDALCILILFLIHDQAAQVHLRQAGGLLQDHFAVLQLRVLRDHLDLVFPVAVLFLDRQAVQLIVPGEPVVHICIAFTGFFFPAVFVIQQAEAVQQAVRVSGVFRVVNVVRVVCVAQQGGRVQQAVGAAAGVIGVVRVVRVFGVFHFFRVFRLVLLVFAVFTAKLVLVQHKDLRFRVYVRIPQDLVLAALLGNHVYPVSVRESGPDV